MKAFFTLSRNIKSCDANWKCCQHVEKNKNLRLNVKSSTNKTIQKLFSHRSYETVYVQSTYDACSEQTERNFLSNILWMVGILWWRKQNVISTILHTKWIFTSQRKNCELSHSSIKSHVHSYFIFHKFKEFLLLHTNN